MPRIYRADHTAHIRDRLKDQALYFSTGVIMAVLGAIAFAILISLLGDAPRTLTAAAWGLVIVLAVVSGIGLTLTGVQYLIYRRRRPDLDAAGAEVIGELYARLHRSMTTSDPDAASRPSRLLPGKCGYSNGLNESGRVADPSSRRTSP